MDEQALTAEEVAKMFKISKHTVYELIKRGELQAFKVGNKMRIEPQEVERFKSNTQASQKRVEPNRTDTVPFIRLSGSHDFIIEHITRYIGQQKDIMQVQPTFIGSLEGLMMLYRGAADIAAIHLLDPNSNQYNVPFIKQLFVHERISVIRLAAREQGLIVAKNNPKQIQSFEDLHKQSLTIVNRQKGSGTRFLLDSYLEKHDLTPQEIKGYEAEEWSHLSAAVQVSRGMADVALGIRSAAEQIGLDFVPITEEQFDLVFRWTDDNERALHAFYQLICSNEFKDNIASLSGYNTGQLGQVMYQKE